MLSAGQILQHIGIGVISQSIVAAGGVRPRGIRSSAADIVDRIQQPVSHDLSQILFLCQVVVLQPVQHVDLPLQRFRGPLVAEKDVHGDAQDRQQADQEDPAHLIGRIVVPPYDKQAHESRDGDEQQIDPDGVGGQLKDHQAQPAHLDQDQRHCDRQSVKDLVKSFC